MELQGFSIGIGLDRAPRGASFRPSCRLRTIGGWLVNGSLQGFEEVLGIFGLAGFPNGR
jgi:hypothetical protein